MPANAGRKARREAERAAKAAAEAIAGARVYNIAHPIMSIDIVEVNEAAMVKQKELSESPCESTSSEEPTSTPSTSSENGDQKDNSVVESFAAADDSDGDVEMVDNFSDNESSAESALSIPKIVSSAARTDKWRLRLDGNDDAISSEDSDKSGEDTESNPSGIGGDSAEDPTLEDDDDENSKQNNSSEVSSNNEGFGVEISEDERSGDENHDDESPSLEGSADEAFDDESLGEKDDPGEVCGDGSPDNANYDEQNFEEKDSAYDSEDGLADEQWEERPQKSTTIKSRISFGPVHMKVEESPELPQTAKSTEPMDASREELEGEIPEVDPSEAIVENEACDGPKEKVVISASIEEVLRAPSVQRIEVSALDQDDAPITDDASEDITSSTVGFSPCPDMETVMANESVPHGRNALPLPDVIHIVNQNSASEMSLFADEIQYQHAGLTVDFLESDDVDAHVEQGADYSSGEDNDQDESGPDTDSDEHEDLDLDAGNNNPLPDIPSETYPRDDGNGEENVSKNDVAPVQQSDSAYSLDTIPHPERRVYVAHSLPEQENHFSPSSHSSSSDSHGQTYSTVLSVASLANVELQNPRRLSNGTVRMLPLPRPKDSRRLKSSPNNPLRSSRTFDEARHRRSHMIASDPETYAFHLYIGTINLAKFFGALDNSGGHEGSWFRTEICSAFLALSNEEAIEPIVNVDLNQLVDMPELFKKVQLGSYSLVDFLNLLEFNDDNMAGAEEICKAFETASEVEGSRKRPISRYLSYFRSRF